MTLNELINKYNKILNDNDLYILNYISQNAVQCSKSNISEIAKASNISSSSIIRMTQKLGFKGYSEFRYFLKGDVERTEQSKVTNADYLYPATVLNDTKETIKLFEDNKNTNEIYNLMRHSNRIYIFATGFAQELTAQEFGRCLLNVGIHLIVIPGKIELGLLSNEMKKDDLLFVISLSGSVNSISSTLNIIAMNGTPIISATLFSRNELASIANYNLYYQTSNVNPITHLNNSSFCTLILLLTLLYEGYINYLKQSDNEV